MQQRRAKGRRADCGVRSRSVCRTLFSRALPSTSHGPMAEYGCDKFTQPFAGINMTSNRFNGRLESSARIAKSALRRNISASQPRNLGKTFLRGSVHSPWPNGIIGMRMNSRGAPEQHLCTDPRCDGGGWARAPPETRSSLLRRRWTYVWHASGLGVKRSLRNE